MKPASLRPRRAAFLDRDGTIIHDVGYLGDPAGVRLLPGVHSALAALRRAGYTVIVVTNQSGVGRGRFNDTAVEAVNSRMRDLLHERERDTLIDSVYWCPHAPVRRPSSPSCACRKPLPGMFRQAAADYGIDLAASVAFGDRARDTHAALVAGCGLALRIGPGADHPSLLDAVQAVLGAV